jgi:hypothetical protein
MQAEDKIDAARILQLDGLRRQIISDLYLPLSSQQANLTI